MTTIWFEVPTDPKEAGILQTLFSACAEQMGKGDPRVQLCVGPTGSITIEDYQMISDKDLELLLYLAEIAATGIGLILEAQSSLPIIGESVPEISKIIKKWRKTLRSAKPKPEKSAS